MQVRTNRQDQAGDKVEVRIGALPPVVVDAGGDAVFSPEITAIDEALGWMGLLRSGPPRKTKTTPSGMTKHWEVYARPNPEAA